MSPCVPKALQGLALPRSTMHPASSQEITPTTLCLLHPSPRPLPHLDQAPLLPLSRVLLVAAEALEVVQHLPAVAAVVAVRLAQTLAVAVEAPAAAQRQRHLAVSLLLPVCWVPMIAPETTNCASEPWNGSCCCNCWSHAACMHQLPLLLSCACGSSLSVFDAVFDLGAFLVLQQHSLPWLHRPRHPHLHRHPHLLKFHQLLQVLPMLHTMLKQICLDWFACVAEICTKRTLALVCLCLPAFGTQYG